MAKYLEKFYKKIDETLAKHPWAETIKLKSVKEVKLAKAYLEPRGYDFSVWYEDDAINLGCFNDSLCI